MREREGGRGGRRERGRCEKRRKGGDPERVKDSRDQGENVG